MVHLTTFTPGIPEFYAGSSVFITGGSGFIGKVLIERLLSTCPDIDKLYLLLREKKGVSPEKRLLQLKQNQAFDVLRSSNPKQLDKMVVVTGDITKPFLGMSATAQAQLRNVSVVFHSAASVRLLGGFKEAVEQNLKALLALLDFTDSLPDLQAFIHVSTAYSNADLNHIEEKVYPPPMDLKELLKIVEDQTLDDEQAMKIIGSKPNPYTFSKAMAEYVLEKHGCKNYPIAIFRPSIVISSMKHPYPGWIDNLNGPSGVIAGTSSGVLRAFRGDADAQADLVPVDLAADTLLAVAWETAVDRLPSIKVYNCTSYKNPVAWGTVQHAVNDFAPKYPHRNVLMYPRFYGASNGYLYKAMEMLLQTFPLHIVEFVKTLFCVKSKSNYITVSKRLQLMHEALNHFTTRQWRFDTHNVIKLMNRLTENDRKLFNLDVNSIHWEHHLEYFVKGTSQFVLKDTEQDWVKARTRVKYFGVLSTVLKLLCFLFILKTVLFMPSVKNFFDDIFFHDAAAKRNAVLW